MLGGEALPSPYTFVYIVKIFLRIFIFGEGRKPDLYNKWKKSKTKYVNSIFFRVMSNYAYGSFWIYWDVERRRFYKALRVVCGVKKHGNMIDKNKIFTYNLFLNLNFRYNTSKKLKIKTKKTFLILTYSLVFDII